MGDVMGAYGKYCAGKRTLIFTVNRAHGKEVRQALEEASQRPLYIDGETPPGERDDILAQWRAERRPLVNIGVFAEGYDEPGIEAVLLANPMKSLARYLQCAGRGCRATPGKANYLLVDCSGSVFDHGSPAAHREWTLEAGHTRVKGKAASFRVCKNCFAVFEGAACELCGTVPSVAPPAKKGVRAELQLIPDSFVPSVDATPKIKDPELEMTDSTRLRRRLYAEMQRQFREPVLTSRVSEAMKSRVVVLWRGASLVLPAHTSLLW
jgi:superfamily II DNA or RNA helicase